MFYFRGDYRVAYSKVWWSRLLKPLLLLLDFYYYLDFPESSSCFGCPFPSVNPGKKTDSQVTCLYKITFSLPRLLFHSNFMLKKNKAVWATDTCLWPLHSSTTEIVSWCLFKSWIKLLPFLSAWLLLFIDKVK